MTVGELLAEGRRRLTEARIESAHLDARLIAAFILGTSREGLLMSDREVVADQVRIDYETLLDRRIGGEPVSRILGRREFWGLEFQVTAATLDPRADTELLIERILADVGPLFQGRILDIGTGTGCLPVALLTEFPGSTAIAVDISAAALDCAIQNADRHAVSDRIEFVRGNWLEGVTGPFDIVVSNPPYIASTEIASLMTEVRAHDPRLALDGGDDGLVAYRAIIAGLPAVMQSNSRLYFEVGHDQAGAVSELLRRQGFSDIADHPDIAGRRRCVSARYP